MRRCVIAELFLEGAPIFTLAQLFKFKAGTYKPSLDVIEDESVRVSGIFYYDLVVVNFLMDYILGINFQHD